MEAEEGFVDRNIELSAEFSRYLFEHPEIEGRIPPGAEIVLLPEFDEDLEKHNLSLGREMEAQGELVIYVSIQHLRPKTLSRIEGVEIRSAA